MAVALPLMPRQLLLFLVSATLECIGTRQRTAQRDAQVQVKAGGLPGVRRTAPVDGMKHHNSITPEPTIPLAHQLTYAYPQV